VSRLDINEVIKSKQDSRIAAIKAADCKSEKLRAEIPELSYIDSALHSVSMKIMDAALNDKEHHDSRLEEIKVENDNLLLKRAFVLEQNGYSADYDSPQFQCKLCSDTGYIGFSFCECVKKQLSKDIYTGSGLGKALFDKSFDNFSLKYYSGKYDGDLSEKETMAMVFGE
jgi:DNA replication protein DnaC